MKLETPLLINDDCLKILRSLESKSIDFILTDPPYILDNHGGVVKGHDLTRKLNSEKHINFISEGFDMLPIFSEFERVLKTVNIVMFCSNKQISSIMSYWENKGYSTTLLVWDKPNPIPFGNGKYISNLEFMIYVRGKKATYNNIGVKEQSKTFRYSAPAKRIHPTEKPVVLLERLLKIHTDEHAVVLDAFAGSFSTGVACKNLNRQFIGIEIEKDFYIKGKKRLNSILF